MATSIRLHPHAMTRLNERGATEIEVIETVAQGERFPAKYGRIGFRRNVYAVPENGWLVITVIVKFF